MFCGKSSLDEDWVDDDDYLPEDEPDMYGEDYLEYLSRLDDPERQVPGDENENQRFIDVYRTSDACSGAETILPVQDGKEDVRSNPALSCKRRRLVGKQSSGFPEDKEASCSQKPVARPQFDEKKQRQMLSRLRYFYLLAGYSKKHQNASLGSLSQEDLSKIFAAFRGHKYFFQLKQKGETRDLGHFMDDVLLHGWRGKGRMSSQDHSLSKDALTTSWGFNLTANGPWGMLDVPGLSKVTDVNNPKLIAKVVMVLKERKDLQKIFVSWEYFIRDTIGSSLFDHARWSISMELCVQSFLESSKVRVHVHAFMDLKGRTLMKISPKLFFLAQRVHIEHGNADRRRVKSMLNNGHYYLQYPKVGSVLQKTNHHCFSDFEVNADWINSAWRKGHITADSAIGEHIMCGQNTKFHIENIQYCEQKRREIRQRNKMQFTALQLRAKLLKFKIPDDCNRWKAQYSLMLDRYKFLVLWGPSKTGKTQWVHWFVPGILEINCGGGNTTPDLHEYDEEEHPGILFDEASLKMIIALKKVFQAGNNPVKLGQTITGKFSYNIFCHKCMMVVCTNDYTKDLKKLKEEDRNWIKDNCEPVHIKSRNQLVEAGPSQ